MAAKDAASKLGLLGLLMLGVVGGEDRAWIKALMHLLCTIVRDRSIYYITKGLDL